MVAGMMKDGPRRGKGGQQPMVYSFPVVIASDQAPIPTVAGEPVAGAAGDVHAPAVNVAAVVTYAAVAGHYHILDGFTCSYYGGIPTGGNLTVTSGGVAIVNFDINEEGWGFRLYSPGKRGINANEAMVITLTAGGAAVTGKLNIDHRLEPA